MKRTLICAGLISVMAMTGIVLLDRTESAAADTASRLRELDSLPAREREAAASAIYTDWSDFCERNFFLTNNECAFEIETALVDIISELRSGEYDIGAECEEAAMLAELYARSTRPCVHNIF